MMKILVVDDDPNILELVSIQLTQAGYTVMKASDGFEALELLEKDLPDLAVVDVMMPRMDGYKLTKKLRAEADIPVLLLTAKGELEDKEKGFLAGSDDYVVKPFEPRELLFRINAISALAIMITVVIAINFPYSDLMMVTLQAYTQHLALLRWSLPLSASPICLEFA